MRSCSLLQETLTPNLELIISKLVAKLTAVSKVCCDIGLCQLIVDLQAMHLFIVCLMLFQFERAGANTWSVGGGEPIV